MAMRIGDQGESEGFSVMEEIPVALHYGQHHRTRKRADFPVVLHRERARQIGS